MNKVSYQLPKTCFVPTDHSHCSKEGRRRPPTCPGRALMTQTLANRRYGRQQPLAQSRFRKQIAPFGRPPRKTCRLAWPKSAASLPDPRSILSPYQGGGPVAQPGVGGGEEAEEGQEFHGRVRSQVGFRLSIWRPVRSHSWRRDRGLVRHKATVPFPSCRPPTSSFQRLQRHRTSDCGQPRQDLFVQSSTIVDNRTQIQHIGKLDQTTSEHMDYFRLFEPKSVKPQISGDSTNIHLIKHGSGH